MSILRSQPSTPEGSEEVVILRGTWMLPWNKVTWQISWRKCFKDWINILRTFILAQPSKHQVNQSHSTEADYALPGKGELWVRLLTWLALVSIMCAFTTSRMCAVNSFISSRGIILKATRLFLFYSREKWIKDKHIQVNFRSEYYGSFLGLYFANMGKMCYILNIFNSRLIQI